MLKNIIILILLSVLVVIGVPQLKWMLDGIWDIYNSILHHMAVIFKEDNYYAAKVNQLLALWLISLVGSIIIFIPMRFIFNKFKLDILEIISFMLIIISITIILH